MDDHHVAIDVLNDLLTHEQRNVATALKESTVFISRMDVEDADRVERIVKASREHAARLAEVVLARGAVPDVPRADPTVSDLHYLELHHVWPHLIADRGALIERYERAVEYLADSPDELAVVEQILQEHRKELDELKNTGTAPATSTGGMFLKNVSGSNQVLHHGKNGNHDGKPHQREANPVG